MRARPHWRKVDRKHRKVWPDPGAPQQPMTDNVWDTIKTNWQQLKARARDEWDQLTDGDLDRIDGDRERLIDAINLRYRSTAHAGPYRLPQHVEAWARRQVELKEK